MKKDTTFLYLCLLSTLFLFACNNPKTTQQETIPVEPPIERPLEAVVIVEEEEEEEEYQPEEPDWESVELEAPNPEDIIASSVNQVLTFANKEEHFTRLKDQTQRNLQKLYLLHAYLYDKDFPELLLPEESGYTLLLYKSQIATLKDIEASKPEVIDRIPIYGVTSHETHLHKVNFTLLSNYDIYVQDSYYYKEKLIESNTLYRYDDEGKFYKVGTQTLTNRAYYPEEKLLTRLEKSALEETGDTYHNPVGTLGIGVATPKRSDLTISVDKDFTHTIQIEDKYKQNFLRPLYNTIYYDIFHFVVDSEGEDYYKIWLNDQEKGYVKKEDFQFITWEELICNALSLSPLTQKAFRNKNEHEAHVTVHMAKGIRTEGDWLQIKTFTEENDYEPTGETLWLKWRKNDKLMVELYFLY